MNQIEMNRIAMSFIQNQSIEVAKKLDAVLAQDLEEKATKIGGPAVHYVHTMAMFDCLASINTFFANENRSDEAVNEYIKYAETLRPRFLDIVEALKDFRPGKQNESETEHNS